MRFRKFLLGLFLLTAVVCCGVEVSGFSNGYSSREVTSYIVVSHQKRELSPSTSALPVEREVETELRYKFTVKISHRFNSSPPRASPTV